MNHTVTYTFLARINFTSYVLCQLSVSKQTLFNILNSDLLSHVIFFVNVKVQISSIQVIYLPNWIQVDWLNELRIFCIMTDLLQMLFIKNIIVVLTCWAILMFVVVDSHSLAWSVDSRYTTGFPGDAVT